MAEKNCIQCGKEFERRELNENSCPLVWRVHTPNLIKEIIEGTNSKDAEAITIPVRIMNELLVKVGERASKIDDPELNALMCRLTIYAIADPQDKNYNPKLVKKILDKVKK